MITLGKYKKLSLSALWKHEAQDFTPWLYENLECLSEVVGFPILKPTKELHTDNFFVDIVGVTGEKDDKIVVIENQYGNSNHDHLGKLITYAAAKDARYAIWIVETARAEHIQAIRLLNSSNLKSKCGFFLIEASVFKIDDSQPVIQFQKIIEPDIIDDEAPASVIQEWWQKFVAQAKERKLHLFANLTPPKLHWMTCGAGKRRVYYEITITKRTVSVGLCMSRNGEKDWGNQCFDKLYPYRVEIEDIFNDTLNWDRMSENYLSRISKTYDGGYESEKWLPLMDNAIDSFFRLEKAFSPFLKEL